MRNQGVISKQAHCLHTRVSEVIPSGTAYSLLDFPNHSNVGDSAIWLGEILLLKALSGREPSYVSTMMSFDRERLVQVQPEGPILIHGGGNFGDIWPWCQEFREMILARFKGRPVIQMPQSISFSSREALDSCKKAIDTHGDFHLFVRDKASLHFAIDHFNCRVQLVPDMAFAIGALRRARPAAHDVFMLLREDRERAARDDAPLYAIPDAVSKDWLDEHGSFTRSAKNHAILTSLTTGAWTSEQRRNVFYHRMAHGRVNRGVHLLSSGRRVVTDRLHAHILSVLLDIPHVVLDNSYGKISGYVDAWTNGYPAMGSATSSVEAVSQLGLLPAC